MTIIREALVNHGKAAHSERAIRLFAHALQCNTFAVRCINDTTGKCTFDERGMSLEAIARVVPKLRHRNANGSGVFIRPCWPFALADDVPAETLDRMLDDNQRIAAVIETSPGSFQVWIPLASPSTTVEPDVCVAACERLVELYGTDPGVAHRDSFGRAPGFRNRKPKHEDDGQFPLVTILNRHSGFRGYDRVLLEEARRSVANEPQLLGKRSAGACAPTDIDPSRSPMTPYEARELYDAEVQRLAELFDWHLPVCKGGRSEVDYHVATGLFLHCGFDPDDIAAVLLFASAKAEEKGLHALNYVKSTVTSALRRNR